MNLEEYKIELLSDFDELINFYTGKDFTPDAFRKTPEREVKEAGRLVRQRGDTILSHGYPVALVGYS